MKTRVVFNCDKKSHASKKHISMTSLNASIASWSAEDLIEHWYMES